MTEWFEEVYFKVDTDESGNVTRQHWSRACLLHSVQLLYAEDMPPETIVTISEEVTGRVFFRTQGNTNGAYVLMVPAYGADGNSINGVYAHPSKGGYDIIATVEHGGANVTDAVTVSLMTIVKVGERGKL